MNENQQKISFSYPTELRNKALELLRQGLSKNKISKELGISFTTIRRWTAGEPSPYSTHYSEETKQKAMEMAKAGIGRATTANELNVGYYSVLAWTRGINTWQKRPPYPPKLKRKARKLVKSGMTKRGVAGTLNVSYNTICDWTADIHSSGNILSGAAEKILAEVVEKGYFMPKSAQLNICRELKQDIGLRLARFDGKRIPYLPSEKEKAIKALLETHGLNYLSGIKLKCIRNLFGEESIKN